MARMSFKSGEDFALKLSRLGAAQEEVARKAVYAGAQVMADAIKANLEALPEEDFRFLHEGDKFDGVPKGQKQELIDSFGVTPILMDSDGNYNAKIGFDGYGSLKTKTYPKGVPNQLIARSIESGSSVRKKHPFVGPAVKAKRKAVNEAMAKVIDAETQKIMK